MADEKVVRLPVEAQVRLQAQGGVATTAQLRGLGMSNHVIAALVKQEHLVRFHRDVLFEAESWGRARPWDRHVLRARGVLLALQPDGEGPYALSHHSALALQDVRVHGVDDRAHLVRTDAQRGRKDTGLQVHAPLHARWVTTTGGFALVRPELACLQVAASFGVEAGLVSTDGALHDGKVMPEEVRRAARGGSFGKGVAAVRTVVEHMNALSESAGESRSRWLMHLLRLPAPELQVDIRDEAGHVIGRVDFLFRQQRTIVEFDGMVKYRTSADLAAEKVREDRLRELGYEVVRLMWADLARPAAVHSKILRAFARAARRGSGQLG